MTVPRRQNAETDTRDPRRARSSMRRWLRVLFLAPLGGVAALCCGFLWFAMQVASEETRIEGTADGIVALTGGPSRINDAVELLASGRGQRLLITGVDPS